MRWFVMHCGSSTKGLGRVNGGCRFSAPVLALALGAVGLALPTGGCRAGEAVQSGPCRVVTLDLATDSLIMQMVDASRLAAVSLVSQDPEVSRFWRKASCVPAIRRESAEGIYQLEPDLVILGPWSSRLTVDLLERLGLNVARMRSAVTWQDVFGQVRGVGELLHAQSEAELLVEGMIGRLDEIRNRTDGCDPKRAVFYIGRGSTYGSGTRQDTVMQSAGLLNVAAEAGVKGVGKLSVEELLLLRPDMIVFSSYHRDTPTLSREILNHPAFRKAAVSGRMELIELAAQDLLALDHGLVDCVEHLARTAYPERFAHIPFAKSAPGERINRSIEPR